MSSTAAHRRLFSLNDRQFDRLLILCVPTFQCAKEHFVAIHSVLQSAVKKHFSDPLTLNANDISANDAVLFETCTLPQAASVYHDGNTLFMLSLGLDDLRIPSTVDLLKTVSTVPNNSKAPPQRIPYIYLQMEQYTNHTYLSHGAFAEALYYAIQVWDYSMYNIRTIQSLLPPSPFEKLAVVPFSYHESILHKPLENAEEAERIAESSAPIDVLFLGALGRSAERRAAINHLVQHCGLHCVAVADKFDEDRESWIRRARVCINIHNNRNPSLLATARLNLLLANGACVVSERSNGAVETQRLYEASNAVRFVDEGDWNALGEVCKLLARDGSKRIEQRRAGLEFIRCPTMSMQNALEQRIQALLTDNPVIFTPVFPSAQVVSSLVSGQKESNSVQDVCLGKDVATPEQLQVASDRFRIEGRHCLALALALAARTLLDASSLPYPDLRWQIDDAICISGYWVGAYKCAIEAGRLALANPNMPCRHRERICRNVRFSESKISDYESILVPKAMSLSPQSPVLLQNVLFINLAHRTDRLAELLPTLQHMGISAERLDAVAIPHLGALGCTLSHIKAIELAQQRCWPFVVILEDDFMWREDVTVEKLHQFMSEAWKNVRHWDVLFLACRAEKYESFLNCARPSAMLQRVTESYTSSGYIIQQHYYDVLLTNLRESAHLIETVQKTNLGPHCLDVHWMPLLRRDCWLRTNPVLGKQRPSYSDIVCCQTHYQC